MVEGRIENELRLGSGPMDEWTHEPVPTVSTDVAGMDKWLCPRGQLETMFGSALRDGLSGTGPVHIDGWISELKRRGSEQPDAPPPPQQGHEYRRTEMLL